MTPSSSFSERVIDLPVRPGRLLMLKTPVRDVVSFRGSFHSYPDFEEGEELVQHLTVMLLDKGTRLKDRFSIADILESRGAQLGFSSRGLRIRFSGRALKQDIPTILILLAELLQEPLFSPSEFDKTRDRLVANLRRSLEDTGSRTRSTLLNNLYPVSHPNYTDEPTDELAHLKSVSVDQIHQYHARHFGPHNLLCVMVGDLDETAFEQTFREAFGSWSPRDIVPRFTALSQPRTESARIAIPLQDKANIDVRMGHTVPIKRDDDDYLPLYIGNYILGGNFSARLMASIRDEMGLTYGIQSGLVGIETEHDGHWVVQVTLSRTNVETGIEATLQQINHFVECGITQTELADKQTTLTGTFQVGLATTGGLANSLLVACERNFGVSYLNEFPSLIQNLTQDDVNGAIRRYFKPDQFLITLAGTLD
jgi:predicted Zn-dependent peptidase